MLASTASGEVVVLAQSLWRMVRACNGHTPAIMCAQSVLPGVAVKQHATSSMSGSTLYVARLAISRAQCRLDFVKGFDGRHVGDYMLAAEPSFVVRLALELQAKPFAMTRGTYQVAHENMSASELQTVGL